MNRQLMGILRQCLSAAKTRPEKTSLECQISRNQKCGRRSLPVQESAYHSAIIVL